MQQKIPAWIVIWLMIGMFINFWDAWYILLRPASFADGSLSAIWLPYARYVKIDISYLDLNNEFIKSIALANFVEISLGLIALYCNCLRKFSLAIILAFSSLLLTGTKTVLVFALEALDGFKHIAHNPWSDLLFLYFLPNLPWIIFPFMAVFTLGRYMKTCLEQSRAPQDDKIARPICDT